LLRTRSFPLNVQSIQRLAVERLDVLGSIREVVANAGGSAVVCNDAAAVAVKEAAKKCFPMKTNDVFLPVEQCDRALMFASRPMLRKNAWPVIPVHRDVHALRATATAAPCSLRRHQSFQRVGASAHDPGIARVQRKPDLVGSLGRGDAPIPEIKTQQIGVVRLRELGWLLGADVASR
jgi:hypothetical protein